MRFLTFCLLTAVFALGFAEGFSHGASGPQVVFRSADPPDPRYALVPFNDRAGSIWVGCLNGTTPSVETDVSLMCKNCKVTGSVSSRKN